MRLNYKSLLLSSAIALLLTACGGGGDSSGDASKKDSIVSADGETMLLSLRTMSKGLELWTTDGTEDGTKIIKDINDELVISSVAGYKIVEMNGILYFTAPHEAYGRELWRSDGTKEGTYVVLDIRKGDLDSYPRGLMVLNNKLFFVAHDGTKNKLYKSDGTKDGTVVISDSFEEVYMSPYMKQTKINGTNRLYFIGLDSEKGYVLCKTDGTSESTVIVKDLYEGIEGAYRDMSYFTYLNGKMLFTALNTERTKKVLWTTDGTSGGTYVLLAQQKRSSIIVGNTLYFNSSDGIWKTDATTSGTRLVHEYTHGSNNYMQFIDFNDSVYFFAKDTRESEYVLWKTDATGNSTIKVFEEESYNYATMKLALDDAFYFTTRGEDLGNLELKKSDGTSRGTQVIKTLTKGQSFGNFKFVLGNIFFDIKENNQHALWTLDSSGNALMLKDKIDIALRFITNIDGKFYFLAGHQLWKTDGTVEGTVLVKGITSGTKSSSPTSIVKMNEGYYFVAKDSLHGQEIWKSDGTEAGTVMVKDITQGKENSPIYGLYTIENTLYFHLIVSENFELWKSDGSESGTLKVKDLGPSRFLSTGKTNVNGTLLFQGEDDEHGRELWVSDGTEEGTKLLIDIESGSQSSTIVQFHNIEGTAYFRVVDSNNDSSWWKSDATEDGTKKMLNFPSKGIINNLTEINGTIFFSLEKMGDQNTTELWKIDTNDTEAVMLKSHIKVHNNLGAESFINANGMLYYVPLIGKYRGADEGTELWKSDGTVEGTKLVSDIGGYTRISDMVYFKKKVYMSFNSKHVGNELWVSDGTREGTKLFKDFKQGKESSFPKIRGVLNGNLVFEATDDTGRKLWKTDGTVEGIELVKSGLK
ncbi:MAG TPA: hypothetical protein EYG82_04185 [Sulfurovum sp.]|nr:hypothetical protein [Sulfurovum sp.]